MSNYFRTAKISRASHYNVKKHHDARKKLFCQKISSRQPRNDRQSRSARIINQERATRHSHAMEISERIYIYVCVCIYKTKKESKKDGWLGNRRVFDKSEKKRSPLAAGNERCDNDAETDRPFNPSHAPRDTSGSYATRFLPQIMRIGTDRGPALSIPRGENERNPRKEITRGTRKHVDLAGNAGRPGCCAIP